MFNKRDQFLAECVAAAKGNDAAISRIAALVGSNQLNVVGHSIYMVKAPGATTTVRMAEESDSKTLGISNLANSKMGPNQLMLVTAIRLVAVTLGAAPQADTIKGANFGSIKGVGALQNGEMDITSGDKRVMKDFPLSNFITDNKQSCELGTYMLDTPKFLTPDQILKIELRTGVNTDANVVIKIELIGIATTN